MKSLYWFLILWMVLGGMLYAYAMETGNEQLLEVMINSGLFSMIWFLDYFFLSGWCVYLFCHKIYTIAMASAAPTDLVKVEVEESYPTANSFTSRRTSRSRGTPDGPRKSISVTLSKEQKHFSTVVCELCF